MVRDHRTEAQILEGCRTGAPGAAAALVARHQRTLYRVAGRLVGRWDVAEEIVQEAFVRVFERIDEIDPDRGAEGWLLRTVLNLARDWHRHRDRRETPRTISGEERPVFAAEPLEPTHSIAQRERRAELERALAKLSPKLREVLVLHYVEERTFPEIARLLRVPIAALKVRAFRARQQLRGALAEKELA